MGENAAPARFGALMPEETSPAELKRIFGLQRGAFQSNPYPSLAQRKESLAKLFTMVKDNAGAFAEAINSDFSCRSPQETKTMEVFSVLEDIRHAQANLKSWMRPKRRLVPIWFQPAKARILRQPLGVLGIIGPWNFPLLLAATPLSAALAAGNRVMMKMSEYTPATDALFSRLIAAAFPQDHVAVISGGAETARAMTHMPFDRLMYTGSPARAVEVLRSAAENLTPVTLELGGKNPAIIHPDYPLDRAAERIMTAKLLNAGQSCVSVDYVMVPAGGEERFVEAARQSALRMYPSMAENPDYTSIVNERHYRRIMDYLEDARIKGARIVEARPDGEIMPAQSRKIYPAFVLGAKRDMTIAQEEIFGPVMMVIQYSSLDSAFAHVNAQPRPLAFYYFDEDSARAEAALRGTVSGGAAINDAVWQFCVSGLPFGGVGQSGMGRYHGEYGFAEFSHEKGIFYQSDFNQLWAVKPPYGWITRLMTRLMIR